MSLETQRVLPAISAFPLLKRFLKSSMEYCILVEFQLAEIHYIIEELKAHNKKVIIHIELIKGISPDEYGAIHLIQNLHVDGIISTKPQVIALAKKRNVIAIQRIFLKDSISLQRSLQVIEKADPDFLEILPAMSGEIITQIQEKVRCKIFCGGLISTQKQIEDCIQSGAIGITVSNPDLWLL